MAMTEQLPSVGELKNSCKGKKVLVIDNYDSFVYNLVQYLGELGAETVVLRNRDILEDQIIEKIKNEIKPSHILISPGPGRPEDAGISNIIIKEMAGDMPVLGVCLGHQAMGELFGAKVCKAPYLMHGKTSEIHHETKHPLFEGIESPYIATRYHSLIIDKDSLESSSLDILAQSDDGLVMAVSHKEHANLVGVQYHPESILSEYGHKLLANFLSL